MGKFAFDFKLLTEFKQHILMLSLTLLCFGYRSKSVELKLS